jgi:hypothetical protein
LVNFTAFGGRSDGIKDAPFRDSHLDVFGDQLVAITRQRNSWKSGFPGR